MPNIKDNVNIQDFNNIFGSNYCPPLITKPIVVKNTCALLNDNIDSDVPINTNNCNSRILEVSFSDHYAIFATLGLCLWERRRQVSSASFKEWQMCILIPTLNFTPSQGLIQTVIHGWLRHFALKLYYSGFKWCTPRRTVIAQTLYCIYW